MSSLGLMVLFEWYIGYRWFDFRFSWGYNLAKAYNVNELAGGIVSLATLISGVAFAPNNTAELAVKVPEKIANAINGQNWCVNC